jgi:hypothetical protein
MNTTTQTDPLAELVRELLTTELGEIACTGSDAPVEDLLGQMADYLARAQLAAPAPQDGWLQDGGLLYRLTDGKSPSNCDEINVAMAGGSRSDADRAIRAAELLALIRGGQAAPAQGVMSDEPKLPKSLVGCPSCMTLCPSAFTADQMHAYARQYAQWHASKRVVPESVAGLLLELLNEPDRTLDQRPDRRGRVRAAYEMLTAAPASRHLFRTTEQMTELVKLEDATGGVFAAGALAAPAVREGGLPLDLLKRLEWSGFAYDRHGEPYGYCPVCKANEDGRTHKDGCTLAGAIAQAQAQQGAGS